MRHCSALSSKVPGDSWWWYIMPVAGDSTINGPHVEDGGTD